VADRSAAVEASVFEQVEAPQPSITPAPEVREEPEPAITPPVIAEAPAPAAVAPPPAPKPVETKVQPAAAAPPKPVAPPPAATKPAATQPVIVQPAPKPAVTPPVQTAAAPKAEPAAPKLEAISLLPSSDYIPVFVRDGKYLVQIAAATTEEGANAEWNKRVKAAPELFSGAAEKIIVQADVNGRTVYRVRAGAFATAADADSFCAAIKAKGGACFRTTR
jgi:SPOR domain